MMQFSDAIKQIDFTNLNRLSLNALQFSHELKKIVNYALSQEFNACDTLAVKNLVQLQTDVKNEALPIIQTYYQLNIIIKDYIAKISDLQKRYIAQYPLNHLSNFFEIQFKTELKSIISQYSYKIEGLVFDHNQKHLSLMANFAQIWTTSIKQIVDNNNFQIKSQSDANVYTLVLAASALFHLASKSQLTLDDQGELVYSNTLAQKLNVQNKGKLLLNNSDTEGIKKRELDYLEQAGLQKNNIPYLHDLVRYLPVGYKSGGDDVSTIQILKKKGDSNNYTIIFPATTGGINPKQWSKTSLNTWGHNLYAINGTSDLILRADEALKKQLKKDQVDISDAKIMVAGFSQGGILAAAYAQKYENKQNIKQVLTVGSPVSNMKISKANVLAIEQTHISDDLVPHLEKAGIKRNNKQKISDENPQQSNWQTIKISNISTNVLPEAKGSIAQGHDVGNYQFATIESQINNQKVIDQFLGDSSEIESANYYVVVDSS